jgi:hypothetical protein
MKFALLLFLLMWQASAFEIRTYSEQVPESNPVTRMRVVDGKTAFSFVPPVGWTGSSDTATRRVSMQLGSQAAIIVQMSTNSMPANRAQLKNQVMARFNNAKIVEEFEAPSGGTPGLGVDVWHTVDSNRSILTRFCVYKTREGTVEVCLAMLPDQAQKVHPFWARFINSFRVEQSAPFLPQASARSINGNQP